MKDCVTMKTGERAVERQLCHHRNELHLKCITVENMYCNDISQNYCFHCIFDQINAALVSIRDFQKH